MNISIAIIEDSNSDACTLSRILNEWAQEKKHDVTITRYNDPAPVINEFVLHPACFDMLFIDVMLPGIQGIDLIKLLQKTNPAILFVLMSAEHAQFMRYGYGVGALDFLCKPFEPDYIFSVMERATERILNAQSAGFSFFCDKIARKLPYNEILLFESCGNYVRLVTPKNTYLIRKAMKDLICELPDNFVMVSRSAIVNAMAISIFTKDSISFFGTKKTVKMAKQYISAVRKVFERYN